MGGPDGSPTAGTHLSAVVIRSTALRVDYRRSKVDFAKGHELGDAYINHLTTAAASALSQLSSPKPTVSVGSQDLFHW